MAPLPPEPNRDPRVRARCLAKLTDADRLILETNPPPWRTPEFDDWKGKYSAASAKLGLLMAKECAAIWRRRKMRLLNGGEPECPAPLDH